MKRRHLGLKSRMIKLDFTTYSTYERCEQEGVWRMQRHLLPSGVEASPHFGHVVHVGVRALYGGLSVREAHARMRAGWTKGVEPTMMANALSTDAPKVCSLCGGWGGGGPVSPASGLPAIARTPRQAHQLPCSCVNGGDHLPVLDPKKPHLSLWRARAIVREYAVQWLNYRSDIPEADADAIAPLTSPLYDVVWNEGYAESATECALPDRCVRMRSDGLLAAQDTKTTSMFVSAAWQRSFEHNQQVAIQLDTLEATLGERVAGFWLDAIHIGRTGAPKAEDFTRYGPVMYSTALRDELRAQRVRQAQRITHLRERSQDALKSPSACVRYNSLCPYFDLCHADPADREALVQIALQRGALKEEAWEPRKRV